MPSTTPAPTLQMRLIGHDSSAVAQPTFSGFGTVTSVYQIPGTLSGARVLSLTGKLIF